MQQTTPNRIVIYAKDIINITGHKERAARKLMAKIRKRYNKANGTYISIFEFCEVTGLKPENVTGFLSN